MKELGVFVHLFAVVLELQKVVDGLFVLQGDGIAHDGDDEEQDKDDGKDRPQQSAE